MRKNGEGNTSLFLFWGLLLVYRVINLKSSQSKRANTTRARTLKGGEKMAKSKKAIAKELRKEYLREWRSKNVDKVREYRERYWLKKAEQYLASQKES